jgi:phosphatidylserine decarboxylase
MSVTKSIRDNLSPIHPEGYLFIAAFVVATLILSWVWSPLFWIGVIATAWCCYFFRDPARVTPLRSDLVVAPADGRVCNVGLVVPPPELGLGPAALPCVSIFMSVFDCHVNRAPVEGRIRRIAYRPGAFVSADLDKASEDNERNGLVIETAQGDFGVVQIAGLIARRIVCFVREGAHIGAGDRFGLIRFGSRVDIYLPPWARIVAGLDSRSVAGETVLAILSAEEPPRQFRKN